MAPRHAECRGQCLEVVKGTHLDQVRELERFLLDVEKRAFRIARIGIRNDEDALDIVQDAMLQLARRYGQRPSEQWRPLFYRILQNRIRDYQRRSLVRSRFFAPPLRSFDDEETAAADPYETLADAGQGPAEQVMTEQALRLLEGALADLPARQREAFLLRTFEGMDVAETAAAMGCSQGSVKTHYSRAVHVLRKRVGEAW